jgi:hypothetical protein
MASKFAMEHGDWGKYRELPGVCEYDFHRAETGPPEIGPPEIGPPEIDYQSAMASVRDDALNELRKAHANRACQYLLLRHGHSTSRLGKTTTRSVIRSLMRSPDATPYIDRAKCIQHQSVFVAALKR